MYHTQKTLCSRPKYKYVCIRCELCADVDVHCVCRRALLPSAVYVCMYSMYVCMYECTVSCAGGLSGHRAALRARCGQRKDRVCHAGGLAAAGIYVCMYVCACLGGHRGSGGSVSAARSNRFSSSHPNHPSSLV
jgi:hypothetical protein